MAQDALFLEAFANPGEALFGLISRMVEQAVRKKSYVDALAGARFDCKIARSPVGQEAVQALTALLAHARIDNP